MCVFVSILIHELGHVFVGRIFGSHGHIVLYSFGGLAIGSNDLPRRWQRIVVSLAGPLVQLLLWGLLVLTQLHLASQGIDWLPGGQQGHLIRVALVCLENINLWWALLNLLPIWPLDGGKISREIFDGLMPGRGIRVSLALSITVAAVLSLNSLAAHLGHPVIPYLPAGGLYMAILFALMAFNNYQELQQTGGGPRRWEDRGDGWSGGRDSWR
jgi:stage IV sporulation protein FB